MRAVCPLRPDSRRPPVVPAPECLEWLFSPFPPSSELADPPLDERLRRGRNLVLDSRRGCPLLREDQHPAVQALGGNRDTDQRISLWPVPEDDRLERGELV